MFYNILPVKLPSIVDEFYDMLFYTYVTLLMVVLFGTSEGGDD
jgi:hypothetical protein